MKSQPRRIVVALGGNAFAGQGKSLTMAGQFRFAHEAMKQMLPLFEDSTQVVVVHGNGPQVGHMLVRVEESLGKAYALPLEVCVAESEGELGYVLAQSLRNVLAEKGIHRPIASLLTQVVVDEKDPGFLHPTKPIGPFYSEQQAAELRERGFVVVQDAGRGLRRVVASPCPLRVIESEVIAMLLDHKAIVVAAGGGGVPVVEKEGKLHGVDAVVDKDLTAALLAESLDAELLLIVTAVPYAYTDYGSTKQAPITNVTVNVAKELLSQGHFAEGSMAPKIEAAVKFASNPRRKAIICDPSSVAQAILGSAGTIVTAGN